jgi:TRAP-type C4-dicarboxylate transport system substrate-binding protein
MESAIDIPSRVVAWALANEYPASSLPGEGDAHFARLVSEKTHGRLAIRAVPDAGLGYRSREQLRAVAEGRIAMADTFSGALGEVEPVFALSTFPFTVSGIGEARALYEATRPGYEAAFARHNQGLLFSTPWPPSGLWTRVPVASIEDLAALSIRAYDETGARLFARLGAQASVVSFSDLGARIAAGDIDAVLSSGDGGAGLFLSGHFSRFTAIEYAMPLSFVTVNLDLLGALDQPLRSALHEAARETEARQWRVLEGRIGENHARMRELGVDIVTDLPAGFRARLREAAGTR